MWNQNFDTYFDEKKNYFNPGHDVIVWLNSIKVFSVGDDDNDDDGSMCYVNILFRRIEPQMMLYLDISL